MKHTGTITLETNRLLMRQYTVNDAYEYACVDSENGEVVWETPFVEQQISELKDVIEKYKNLDFY